MSVNLDGISSEALTYVVALIEKDLDAFGAASTVAGYPLFQDVRTIGTALRSEIRALRSASARAV